MISRVMFEKLCTDLQKSVFWISKCFVFQTIHKCGELHFGIWRRCTEGCSRTAEENKEKEEGNVPAPCWLFSDMDGKHDEVTERCGGGFMTVGCLMLGRRVYRAGTRHLLGLILLRFLPAVWKRTHLLNEVIQMHRSSYYSCYVDASQERLTIRPQPE